MILRKLSIIFLAFCFVGFLASCATKLYTVTFDSTGGTSIESYQVESGTMIVTPVTAKEGYTLDGWFTSSDGGNTLDDRWSFTEDAVKKDITLYASWIVNSYTLSFETNDGTNIASVTQDYQGTINEPEEPTKLGYTFDGWYTDESLTIPFVFTTMPSHDVLVYAKWTSDGYTYIDQLTISFVPSRDNETLYQGLSYLPTVLKDELENHGFRVNTINTVIETSYESAGLNLYEGVSSIAFVPAATYVMYSDNHLEPILAATRTGLSKDSINPMDWNDGLPTTSNPNFNPPYYRSIGVAGVSPKGRELANKINSGQQITWDDLQTVKIGVQSVTSSSGRVYPSLLFAELYDGKTLYDLPANNVIQLAGYGAGAAALASGEVDIAFGYADFRMDYADEWISTDGGGYGRTSSIWDETDVVYVTARIFNDVVAINKEVVNPLLQIALEESFMSLINDETLLDDPSGMFVRVKDIFLIYSHLGYIRIEDTDLDYTRLAVDFLYN